LLASVGGTRLRPDGWRPRTGGQEGHRAWRRIRAKLAAEGLASQFPGAPGEGPGRRADTFMRLDAPAPGARAAPFWPGAPRARGPGPPAAPARGAAEEEEDAGDEGGEGEGGGGGGQLLAECGFDWQVISLLLDAGAYG